MALSAFEAFARPRRPDSVIAGSRLAKLVSFMARADGVRPILSAIRATIGLRAYIFPKGIWQYRFNAIRSSSRDQFAIRDLPFVVMRRRMCKVGLKTSVNHQRKLLQAQLTVASREAYQTDE